jgi:RNA polymerase subunit RPABC4/transcription elongation factor Spt4
METRECPGCAVEVDADAEKCPICGYEFPKQPIGVKIMAWVMVILLLAWLVL